MSQTVTRKQCTKSKIGLGAPGAHPEPRLSAHCVCTAPGPRAQRALGVVSWLSPRSYRGRARSCRKPSQLCRRPGRAPCRRTPVRIAVCHVAAHVSCRGALLRCIVAQCHRIATQSRPPQPQYKSLYRDPAPSRTHYVPYCRLPGRIVAEQWSCRGLQHRATRCLPALCHDTIHCIVTQLGSSPSAAS